MTKAQLFRFATGVAALGCALAAASCGIFKHTVNITLAPGTTFTISSTPPSVSGQTATPITVQPSSAGSSYTGNQSHVSSATLTAMTFDITPNSDDLATQLTAASVTITDTVTSQSNTYTLGSPLVFAGVDGGVASNVSDTITQFSPDPTPFATSLFKTGDAFTVSASGTADNSPVDINVTLNFAVALTVGEP
jgi:hypothetical protein